MSARREGRFLPLPNGKKLSRTRMRAWYFLNEQVYVQFRHPRYNEVVGVVTDLKRDYFVVTTGTELRRVQYRLVARVEII